jgi:AraC-like DNA-binding protein
MMFSTASSAPRHRGREWTETISSAYYPLDLSFTDEAHFSGELQIWSVGPVSLSRLECDGLLYRRHKRHLLVDHGNDFLITIPDRGEVGFHQESRDVRCSRGGFLVERSDVPYDFWHRERSALWVMKAPCDSLRARIGPPERLSGMTFDATRGVGALFIDMISTAAPRLDEMNEGALDVLGRQIIELLCLAIQADDRVLDTHLSSVRAAHLYRAEQYIRANLERSELMPQQIADACGISLRYLQQLFTDTGRSVCDWVREQRLIMCGEELRKPNSRLSISEIAYRWGFADQSQFSKHYRKRFGRTPSETRMQYRDGRSNPQ